MCKTDPSGFCNYKWQACLRTALGPPSLFYFLLTLSHLLPTHLSTHWGAQGNRVCTDDFKPQEILFLSYKVTVQ